MEQKKVFISVGGTATTEQEDFVKLIEDRLRSENLIPSTVGRNNFTSDSPLKAVKELMNECSGILIIALERTYFENGIEKRGGSQETSLSQIKFSTPWNQIESGMAYAKGLPILVVLEKGLREEGLLERGYDWYIMRVLPNQQSLTTPEFNGVLASWKNKVEKYQLNKIKSEVEINPGDLTVGKLISYMKPGQLWGVLAAIAALMIGIFVIGQHFPAK
ncbi:hypothetical protein [Flavobacterium silvaticum]|uniref:Uncharacterized protein n=1 Tax=Flavobacterium silvaticum TaxID=1852020 RepID=A0A972FS29_9FLAO|nr:hypothetical protein [Flavobacterium silvaticum]NMH26495.1 hypothetical protein [Flavobacterium silvaticum]